MHVGFKIRNAIQKITGILGDSLAHLQCQTVRLRTRKWMSLPHLPVEVWRSRAFCQERDDFLIELAQRDDSLFRISVSRLEQAKALVLRIGLHG